MSPDFGYYIGQFERAKTAHSLAGIFILCLPASLLLALLLRALQAPLVSLLPQPHRGALLSLPARPPLSELREWLVLALAIVTGAATHVAWDSLTHNHGLPVQAWPLLQRELLRIGSRQFLVYNTLQHASTVLGSACVALVYLRWVRRVTPPGGFPADGRDGRRAAWLALCGLAALAVGLPSAIAAVGPEFAANRPSMILVHTVIHATTVFALLYSAAALVWYRRTRTSGT